MVMRNDTCPLCGKVVVVCDCGPEEAAPGRWAFYVLCFLGLEFELEGELRIRNSV
jgi:hypothetical protein